MHWQIYEKLNQKHVPGPIQSTHQTLVWLEAKVWWSICRLFESDMDVIKILGSQREFIPCANSHSPRPARERLIPSSNIVHCTLYFNTFQWSGHFTSIHLFQVFTPLIWVSPLILFVCCPSLGVSLTAAYTCTLFSCLSSFLLLSLRSLTFIRYSLWVHPELDTIEHNEQVLGICLLLVWCQELAHCGNCLVSL